MIRRIALATAAVTAAALSTGITWSAAADATTPAVSAPPVDHTVGLPVGNFTDLLVDNAAGKVFVAGTNGVAVGELDGSGMTLIPNVHSARKLALNPVDHNVYVAENDDASETLNHITEIDPATATVIHSWSVGDSIGCVHSLAFAGADLWFTYDCSVQPQIVGTQYGYGHLDTTTGAVKSTVITGAVAPSQLRSVPGRTDELVATGLNGNQDLELVAVSGDTATVTYQTGLYGGETGPLTVVSDGAGGANVLYGDSIGVRSFSSQDLSATAATFGPGNSGSVAVSGDGTHAAVASVPQYQPTFATYTYPAGAVVHNYPIAGDYTSAPNQPARQSLAWNDDVLYSVYTNYAGNGSELHILNTALQAPAAMSLRSVASVGRAKLIALTGHLAATTGASLAGASVVVTKRDQAGTHPVGTFTTDSAGMYHVADIPSVGGTNTYIAVFAGDQDHSAVTAVDNVNVLRGTPVLTMKLTSKLYSYHQLGHLTVHLTSHDVKKVQIWIKAGPAPQHYYTTLTVNAHGDAAMNMTMTYNTLFVVKFYGDYYYNPRVISTSVGTRAAALAAVSGNYGTNGAYKLFHPGDDVYQGALVYPNQYGFGTCTHFNIYIYAEGRWQLYASSPCLTYQSNGVSFADLQGADTGYQYRAQAVFNSSAYNVGTVSAYAYFIVR